MGSSAVNQDVLSEILSHCSISTIGKLRLLNKECNRRTYESTFMNLHCQRTNSISGYFIQNLTWNNYSSNFYSIGASKNNRGSELSLDFLPPGKIKIEACDASHGILLCINENPIQGIRFPQFIVCKPSTKQYRFIPRPKIRYFTLAFGIMVVRSNPFRYKILRLSKPSPWETHRPNVNYYFLLCEIFDSDSWAWKRMADIGLPEIIRFPHAVSSSGSFHWLTAHSNVFQFCLKTETWSLFPLPQDLVHKDSVQLVKYQGKFGVICSKWKRKEEEFAPMWVLDSTSKRLWVKVKTLKILGPQDGSFSPIWFHGIDVAILAGYYNLILYNINNGNSENLRLEKLDVQPEQMFSFYSDTERVDLMGPNEYKIR